MAGILQDYHTLHRKAIMDPKPFTALEVTCPASWGVQRVSVTAQMVNTTRFYRLTVGDPNNVSASSWSLTDDVVDGIITVLTAARDAERKRTEVKV